MKNSLSCTINILPKYGSILLNLLGLKILIKLLFVKLGASMGIILSNHISTNKAIMKEVSYLIWKGNLPWDIPNNNRILTDVAPRYITRRNNLLAVIHEFNIKDRITTSRNFMDHLPRSYVPQPDETLWSPRNKEVKIFWMTFNNTNQLIFLENLSLNPLLNIN